MLPPIRYPLPSFVALLLAGLLAWGVEVGTRAWRLAAANRVREAINGPPVPRSDHPEVVAGPIVRRGLLRHDGTPIFDQPRGKQVETIARRGFVDIYDEWPTRAAPTHVRVGTRAPLGWIKGDDLLGWNTRLVVQPPDGTLRFIGGESVASRGACPVVGWRADAVEVVVWAAEHPWEVVAHQGWVASGELPAEVWGVWVSSVELPSLLNLSLGVEPDVVRLRAVLGRVVGGEPISAADLAVARPALPALLFDSATRRPGATDRLAEANAQPRADARWAGLAFRFLPLADLP